MWLFLNRWVHQGHHGSLKFQKFNIISEFDENQLRVDMLIVTRSKTKQITMPTYNSITKNDIRRYLPSFESSVGPSGLPTYCPRTTSSSSNGLMNFNTLTCRERVIYSGSFHKQSEWSCWALALVRKLKAVSHGSC